ncbi:hypothetical protein [Thalassotalea ganghwensis]
MALKNWIASYSGCDGGSPDLSEIWFVGIEWGFAKVNGQTDREHFKAVADYHSGGMSKAIKLGYADPHDSEYVVGDNIDYTFGRNSAKLITAVKGYNVKNYNTVVHEIANSEVFKLNLYPIGLPNTEDNLWGTFNLDRLTGLATKQEYRNYCKEHRFPFFREEFNKHKPRLILCTGTSYIEDFASCFLGIDNISELTCEELTDVSLKNNKPRKLYWKWASENTLFATVPFMTNPSGLNSHSLLQQFGTRIKEILDEKYE